MQTITWQLGSTNWVVQVAIIVMVIVPSQANSLSSSPSLTRDADGNLYIESSHFKAIYMNGMCSWWGHMPILTLLIDAGRDVIAELIEIKKELRTITQPNVRSISIATFWR